MSIDKLNSLVKAIAERADAEAREVHAQHFISAMKTSQSAADPFPDLSASDRAAIQKIQADARAEIAAALLQCGDLSAVASLAAGYVLREASLQRLANARAEGLEVKRHEVRSVRDRLQDERLKVVFHREQAAKSNTNAKSSLAKSGAKKRHAPANAAKAFVIAEWAKHRGAYENNKSAFARDYAGRVRNEFEDSAGKPLDIKEKTIREIWLRDPQSTGK